MKFSFLGKLLINRRRFRHSPQLSPFLPSPLYKTNTRLCCLVKSSYPSKHIHPKTCCTLSPPLSLYFSSLPLFLITRSISVSLAVSSTLFFHSTLLGNSLDEKVFVLVIKKIEGVRSGLARGTRREEHFNYARGPAHCVWLIISVF